MDRRGGGRRRDQFKCNWLGGYRESKRGCGFHAIRDGELETTAGATWNKQLAHPRTRTRRRRFHYANGFLAKFRPFREEPQSLRYLFHDLYSLKFDLKPIILNKYVPKYIKKTSLRGIL